MRRNSSQVQPRRGLHAILLPAVCLIAACSGSDNGSKVDEVDTSDTSTEFPEVSFDVDIRQEIQLPPDFGDPCDENSDCSQSFCVEGPSGFVCTKTCVEECPDGWGCKGVQSGSSDVTFVCVPDGSPQPDAIINDTEVVNDITADTSIVTETADTGPTDGSTDTDADIGPVTGNACEAAPGSTNENYRTEQSMTAGDWPDCVVGCNFETNPTIWVVDLRTQSYTAVRGQFDGDGHLYDFEGGARVGPDIDVIAIKAAPRTMLEFAVLKDVQASFTEPLVYLSDGFQVRTFNSDVSSDNTCGRTTMAFPFVSELPIYAIVEDAVNYDRWSPTGYASGTVGGTNYGWSLRIRTSPFAPTELGALAIGQTRPLTGERLTVGGELRYYRFYAPGTSRPRVTITKTSGGSFSPSVVGLKTIQGELVWQRVVSDGGNGVLELSSTGFRPCVPLSECPSGVTCPANMCTDGQTEFVFAVYDFNGDAGPGTFGYDVTVRVE